MKSSEIIKFWFDEIPSKNWWIKDSDFDNDLQERFLHIYEKAVRCELFSWRMSAEGRLAEIIVLDQFARNMFRGDPRSFLYDPLALSLSQTAIQIGADKELESSKKAFLYMPYMHSESAAIHEEAVKIFSQSGLESNLDFELKHKAIIDRFGRYPHRNEILGRKSTTEELEFLNGPNSSF